MNNGFIGNTISGAVAAIADGAGGGGAGGGANAPDGPENGTLPIVSDPAHFIPEPVWMAIARREIGQKEVHDGENPRIILYHSATDLAAKEDEVPWCSSFVNWVMQKAQMESTRSAAARSWATWGESLDHPVYGAIIVLTRVGGGHVTFFDHVNAQGQWICLGGNQADSVCERPFDPAELWAAAAALLWASWVSVTGSDLTHSAAYSVILSIADEDFWVYTGFALGLTHIGVVLADGRLLRRLVCATAAFWWSTLFLSMLMSVPRAPGLALFFIMSMINMVSATRTLQRPS